MTTPKTEFFKIKYKKKGRPSKKIKMSRRVLEWILKREVNEKTVSVSEVLLASLFGIGINRVDWKNQEKIIGNVKRKKETEK